MTVDVRPAVEADLPAVFDVWRAAAYPDRPSASPSHIVPSLFNHELTTGHMWVAEDGGRLVGFAVLLVRGGIGFVAELFVLPDSQSRGIGSLLLKHALAIPATTYCTMSSHDPRALALYVRAGLQPMWPHFLLTATSPVLTRVPGGDVTVAVAEPGDPKLMAWDSQIAGRARPEDHAYWQRALAGTPLWFARAGVTVGYGYAWQRPRGDQVGLGPLGTKSPTDAVACVGAALRWLERKEGASGANTQIMRRSYHVAVPGQHPALMPLLQAGFQIVDIETFCCSRPDLFFDPQTYLASSGPEGTSIF